MTELIRSNTAGNFALRPVKPKLDKVHLRAGKRGEVPRTASERWLERCGPFRAQVRDIVGPKQKTHCIVARLIQLFGTRNRFPKNLAARNWTFWSNLIIRFGTLVPISLPRGAAFASTPSTRYRIWLSIHMDVAPLSVRPKADRTVCSNCSSLNGLAKNATAPARVARPRDSLSS